jgi:hypothetical protein
MSIHPAYTRCAILCKLVRPRCAAGPDLCSLLAPRCIGGVPAGGPLRGASRVMVGSFGIVSTPVYAHHRLSVLRHSSDGLCRPLRVVVTVLRVDAVLMWCVIIQLTSRLWTDMLTLDFYHLSALRVTLRNYTIVTQAGLPSNLRVLLVCVVLHIP